MQISGTQFGSGGVTLSVTVTNTGEREGKEVVQLYVSDKASSVTVPAIALKRFCKISLAPGESRRVSFQVFPEDLGLWNADMEYVTEPGEFEFSFRIRRRHTLQPYSDIHRTMRQQEAGPEAERTNLS